MAERRQPLLIVDLDGTLLRGDQPVREYAAAAAAGLAPTAQQSLREALDAYLRQGVAAAAGCTADASALRGALDGWHAVALLARRRGVPRDRLDQAFAATREAMAAAGYPIEVPAAFAEALRDLSGEVRRLLVTNSPRLGLAALFDRFGIAELFDGVVAGANKPEGLRELLPRELERTGLTDRPWWACSIGDLWRNDLEPAVTLGVSTLYIDRFGRADGVASVSSRTVEQLLPALRRWAEEPDTFAVSSGSGGPRGDSTRDTTSKEK